MSKEGMWLKIDAITFSRMLFVGERYLQRLKGDMIGCWPCLERSQSRDSSGPCIKACRKENDIPIYRSKFVDLVRYARDDHGGG